MLCQKKLSQLFSPLLRQACPNQAYAWDGLYPSSAAITAALAVGNALSESILLARQYVQQAIETAPRLGHGMGPVNHFASRSTLAGI